MDLFAGRQQQVSNVPDTIVLERDRDLRATRSGVRAEVIESAWPAAPVAACGMVIVSAALFKALGLVLTVVVFMVPLLALLNLFGQRPSHSHAATPAVKLSVDARYLGASK